MSDPVSTPFNAGDGEGEAGRPNIAKRKGRRDIPSAARPEAIGEALERHVRRAIAEFRAERGLAALDEWSA